MKTRRCSDLERALLPPPGALVRAIMRTQAPVLRAAASAFLAGIHPIGLYGIVLRIGAHLPMAGDACVELSTLFRARDHGAAHAYRHEFSILQHAAGYAYDRDLLAASSVTSRTPMPARKRHSTNTAIDR
jgi:hypothetical protein